MTKFGVRECGRVNHPSEWNLNNGFKIDKFEMVSPNACSSSGIQCIQLIALEYTL